MGQSVFDAQDVGSGLGFGLGFGLVLEVELEAGFIITTIITITITTATTIFPADWVIVELLLAAVLRDYNKKKIMPSTSRPHTAIRLHLSVSLAAVRLPTADAALSGDNGDVIVLHTHGRAGSTPDRDVPAAARIHGARDA